MLSVSNLAVDHGKMRAVWNVSFRVEEGEKVALLGANGAGKSTTLGAIIGVYPICGGEVRFRDHAVNGASSAQNVAAGMALVPEGRRLFPEMSVRENLALGCYLPAVRSRVDERLDRVYQLFPVLQERARQPAGELSGGQQQMVAIGRALMSGPKLLLLDEPFIGVAPIVVDEVIAALQRIVSEGLTILLVEQNVHRALEFVQRAYVIENGRSVLEGTSAQLLQDAEFSSKFLGLD
ncbi:MAG TPA: ABC transporter ATP-binding protein [Xanthobacteraceae bacterium]